MVAQHLLIKKQMSRSEIRRVAAIDGIYGISALVAVSMGLKNRKGDQQELLQVPGFVKMVIRFELLLLFIIPLLATLMAQGVGSLISDL